ncbi:DUF3060 domain-containing protein [Humibacter ginsenosidimutans]|nr:DUF3060 domain-containing protein [Humibacter ginsenosidimutans]
MPPRTQSLRRAASVLLVGGCLVGLAACSETVQPTDDPTVYTTGGHVRCSPGQSVELDGPSHHYVVGGECGAVHVRGNGVTVLVDRAVSLDVQGQSVTVTAQDRIGSAVLKGNGISVTSGSIGSVVITGQNNAITAPALGSVVVEGDRNVVTTKRKPSEYRVSGDQDTLTLQ